MFFCGGSSFVTQQCGYNQKKLLGKGSILLLSALSQALIPYKSSMVSLVSVEKDQSDRSGELKDLSKLPIYGTNEFGQTLLVLPAKVIEQDNNNSNLPLQTESSREEGKKGDPLSATNQDAFSKDSNQPISSEVTRNISSSKIEGKGEDEEKEEKEIGNITSRVVRVVR